ncbi:uncharacterized protein [Onthophagus taurus]|uniref:uncharacterized protein isoform X1 n=1 Tax=Onthophagus taurus TaxID=166361 RepID=UPI0039BE316C
MEEYLSLGHMIECSKEISSVGQQFFLPHHGVIKESSTSTKLRVVFNGSQKSTSGMSLNDYLLPGPKLQNDLVDVLMRWRQHPVAFAADIEKMYRQIKVHSDHLPFQQILWRTNPSDPIKIYQLSTVTYGLTCAPYLAIRCLHQLAEEHSKTLPFASDIILNNIYVDDILSGANDTIHAREKIHQLNGILMAGGFLAKKWSSNSQEIIGSLPEEYIATSDSRSFENNLMYRTLGLIWKSNDDSFIFSWKTFSVQCNTFTKRSILSVVAQMFTAKLFMQELWLKKIDWDEKLPDEFVKRWCTFIKQFHSVSEIAVPSWLGLSNHVSVIEIHGFSDASQQALAAVVYLRVISNNNNKITVTIVSAKTKVAPLKRITIPRLELCAALMLVKLVHRVQKTLKLSDHIHLWTDSTIVLHWITNHPSRWKEFISNRVAEIQELSSAQWHHVVSEENPADLASRGVLPSELPNLRFWWRGPEWLNLPNLSWSQSIPSCSESENFEERTSHTSVITSTLTCWDLIERYSSLTRLLRVTAWCLRFVKQCNNKCLDSVSAVLSTSETNDALLVLVKHVQKIYFAPEISILMSTQSLPRSNRLHRLIPFIDGNGFLRLSGRLQFTNLNWNEKHPLILPKMSSFTTLVIRYHHLLNLHGGTQVTLASLRRQFWILGGRLPVRSFIHKCMVCARQRTITGQQLMGQLPKSRIIPSRSFLNTGVDYAGPFSLRTLRGRGGKIYKGYLIIFVCLSTSAIHLEVATDYTSSGFIAAYKRFVGRRGIAATITSDCGTNLVGADRELRNLFNSASE